MIQPSILTPTHSVIQSILIFFVVFGLSACFEIGKSGNGGSQGGGTAPSVAAKTVFIAPGDADCPYGGALVETGIDENTNGVLDPGEVDASEKVCNGAPGLQGELGTDTPDRTVALCDLYHLKGKTLPEFCPPPPSRFVYTGGGVLDTQTRLVWEKKAEWPHILNWVGYTYAWICRGVDPRPSACDVTDDETVFGFISSRNWNYLEVFPQGSVYVPISLFTGYKDWRLPTVAELKTILLDGGAALDGGPPCSTSPCIDPIFGPTQAACYWTSTNSLRTPGLARIGIDFSTGYGCSLNAYTDGVAYARAVRRID